MKKFVSFVIISACLAVSAHATKIVTVRHSASMEKLRVVIELDAPVKYTIFKEKTNIIVSMPYTVTDKDPAQYKVWDGMLKTFDMVNADENLNLFIDTAYQTESNIFSLQDPFRIVIDLPRQEMTPEAEEIASTDEASIDDQISTVPDDSWFLKSEGVIDGISLLKVKQKINKKNVNSWALLANTNAVDVMPVISVPEIKGKDGNPIFGALSNIFSFFMSSKPERYAHFQKRRVSSFVNAMGAIAGINGSFFYGDGTPVGALIVNGQIISTPLYNRTALIIYNDGRVSIDSVNMQGYLKLKGNETLGFAGVNQPIKKDDIIVYTPDFQQTDPSTSSTNISVVNGKAENITYGETKIPKNGFVISANGIAGEAVKERIRVGDEVKWFFMASPPLNEIKHVIAGGPRLVYNGQSYVTSKEEKFRNDVAKSRAARTAVGITNDGNLLLVVVEGNGSSGMTLTELASLMIKLGAQDAMNLDGGGSSTIFVDGKTLNHGAGRAVSNAIVLIKK